jgi:membrane protein insertase Oxa1/YidC/SpoIIIJ
MKCDLPMRFKAYYYIRAILKYSKDVNVNLFAFAAYNMVQLPIFLLMVMSIRKIATEEDLTNKGILWFPNLNEADPYMILPIISVVVTYFNLGVIKNLILKIKK